MGERKVIFRADAGPTIGMGHFMRSLSLIQMLKNNFHCLMATRKPSDFQLAQMNGICDWIELQDGSGHFDAFLEMLKGDEIVVLDNYFFTTDYQREIRDKGCKLVCIDDVHQQYFVSDLIINHAPINPSVYQMAPHTQLRIGMDYVMLRPPFFSAVESKPNSEFKHALICFGGVDVNNLTTKTIKSLESNGKLRKITALVSSSFSHMHELKMAQESVATEVEIKKDLDANEMVDLIRSCDFAIVPCSTVLYEVLSQNKPVITGYYIDNQQEISDSIAGKYPHIAVIGDFKERTPTIKDVESLELQVKNSGVKELINDQTKDRFRKEFLSLHTEFDLTIRRAQPLDVDLFFEWANDPQVRSNAISTDAIPYENHVAWYQKKMKASDSFIYVIERGAEPVGQVRFDANEGSLIIDYSIDKAFRGKRMGKVLLKLALVNVIDEMDNLPVQNIIGKVKYSNKASSNVFQQLSFENIGDEEILGEKYFVFKKNV